jgi:hypothetical protein
MPTDLSGLWTFGPDEYQLDNGAAVQAGHTYSSGVPGPHGTYLKKLWYRIYHSDDNHFYIFDENAEFQHFQWLSPTVLAAMFKPQDFGLVQMPEVWQSNNMDFEFSLPKGDKYAPQGRQGRHQSRLRLMKADKIQPSLNINSKWCPGIAQNVDDLNRQQFIYFDQKNKRIYWLPEWPDPHEPGLEFFWFEPQARRPVVEGNERFGEIFKTTEIAQLLYPFYGYNPRAVGFGSETANLYSGLLSPGTTKINYDDSNPTMIINNALLFEFPALDSGDHRLASELPHQPRLPLGLTGKFVDFTWEHSHTEEVSSTVDLARSWSTTLGFNAGVEKMMSLGLSGGYGKQKTKQTQRRARFTISRAVTVKYAFRNDVPNLLLQRQFLGEIESQLNRLEPSWVNLTNNFGTHYVHSMTHGSMQYAVTTWSLVGELAAREKHYDLKIVASGGLDNAKAGGEKEFRTELKNKLEVETQTEDVDRMGIGSPAEPVAIFFDLRPIAELLNPILLPYNPVDAQYKYSPFFWYDLRKSLSRHLEGLGLNKPLERTLADDLTPRLVKLTVAAVDAYVDDRRTFKTYPAEGMLVTGNVELSQVKKVDDDGPEAPYLLKPGARKFEKERVDGDNYKPDDQLSCVFATRRGQAARVKMKIALKVEFINLHLGKPGGLMYDPHTGFYAESVMVEGINKEFRNEVNEDGEFVYSNMHFHLKWEEVKW